MKRKLTALVVAAACAVSTSSAIAHAQPHADQGEPSTRTVSDLTGEEIFKAFYFGSGTGTEVLSNALQDKHYDEFVQNVESQRPVDETNRDLDAIAEQVQKTDPGHFDLFKDRITSGDPFEFRDQLGATTEVLNTLQEKAKSDQTSTPGQVKPDAAVPVWATALAVQWAGAAYQYAAVANAAVYATVAVLTKAAFWDHTKSEVDVDQMTAEVAPKLAD